MPDIKFIQLDPIADLERVSDLTRRAIDYVTMETHGTDIPAFVKSNLVDAPPVCGPDDIFLRGLERPDGSLAGYANSIRHYPEHGHWYMGLLLLDPAERGQGLGRRAATRVMDEARADNAPCIRIAVLDVNTNARKFWAAMGYEHERTVPGDPNGDGHIRHVLKCDLTPR
jgi:ribosomal protein S18 acetylase RimI-like enzyme